MTSKTVTAVVLAFLVGAAFPLLIIWNPARWSWPNRLTKLVEDSKVLPAEGQPDQQQLWTCGMHPHVIQNEPGNCPICQMTLVPVRDSGGPAAPEDRSAPEPSGGRRIKYWRAPMDPSYISDKPGKSPMGMDLVPVYEDEIPVERGVRVDPNFIQNFGVRTEVVEEGFVPVEIRTVGTLAHNEENLVSVNAKFEGWIEKAYVNNIGEHVQRRDPLFEIYSPQLVTTQKEYLAAKEYLEKLQASGYADAEERARSLLESARERLGYWDISDAQISQLDRTGRVLRTFTIASPARGHVVAKTGDSLEGMKVSAGETILKIADHSVLWAEVEFFEHQIQHLREGQRVQVEVDAFPRGQWHGNIAYFRPAVDPQTRTLKAFVEVNNDDLMLRPQMFVNVVVSLPPVSGAVLVPREAILHSGERSIVIVRRSRGLFEPREVELGAEGHDYQEVRRGLQPGEVVVTSSQFLIDSESNLKAAIRQLLGERSRSQGIVDDEDRPSPMLQQQ